MNDINTTNAAASQGAPAPSNPSIPSELDATYPHLRKETAALLNESIEKRCDFVYQDRYIMHDRAKTVLGTFKQLLHQPKGVRPPCLAFVGGSNEGKSATVNRFLADHNARVTELFSPSEGDVPILYVEMPSRATEPRICLAIARALGLAGYGWASSKLISDNVYRALGAKKVKLIFLNEAQHAFHLPVTERRVVCDFIKGITNHGISVIAVGTAQALALFSEDEQNANRMRVLKMGCFANDGPFRDFLKTLESYYPLLESSELGSPKVAKEIYNRTNGICGEVIMLCNAAAAFAIRGNQPRIDYGLIKRVQVLPPANAA